MTFALFNPATFTKPKRPVFQVFLHCSASDNPAHDNAQTIHEWHLARQFKEIGYHYFIRKNGQIEAGRCVEKTPAAQAGHNAGTIAICVHGLKKSMFTEAQKSSLKALCQAINKAHYNTLTFHGHCEVSAKSCPVFDYREWLDLDKHGRINPTKEKA